MSGYSLFPCTHLQPQVTLVYNQCVTLVFRRGAILILQHSAERVLGPPSVTTPPAMAAGAEREPPARGRLGARL